MNSCANADGQFYAATSDNVGWQSIADQTWQLMLARDISGVPYLRLTCALMSVYSIPAEDCKEESCAKTCAKRGN